MEYFGQGSVRDLGQFGNKITTTVTGTSDYRVTIRIDKESVESSCTCPYDWGGCCKHIVATLLALSENYPRVKKDKEEREKRIEKILNNLSLDELKKFLMTEFAQAIEDFVNCINRARLSHKEKRESCQQISL